MKMFSFIFLSLVLGGAIAAYIKIPKNEETAGIIKLCKFIIGIMILTLVILFGLAMVGSTTSIKLF